MTVFSKVKTIGVWKTIFISALCFLIFSTITASAVFFSALRGAEQVLVPDVVGKNLVQALTELQAKELYPRINTKEGNGERYLVVEQEPRGGTIVKAGRRIRLVVLN